MGRTPCCSKVGLHRGAWSADEDKLLINHIQTHGEGQWRSLPSKAGLLRCGKSCRLRWMNYLRPGIKRGNFTTEENDAIIRLRSLHGNRWSLIATELPGRTDNDIKNHWNAHLSKLTETVTNHRSKNKKKKKIMKLDDQKAETTSQQKSTKVKIVDPGHTPSSSLSSSASSKNEGASSSCTVGFEDVDLDFDFDFLWSKWTPLLEVEDECFLMDDYDVVLEKDDERLMLENLYDEYLNLLNHQDVD